MLALASPRGYLRANLREDVALEGGEVDELAVPFVPLACLALAGDVRASASWNAGGAPVTVVMSEVISIAGEGRDALAIRSTGDDGLPAGAGSPSGRS